MSRQQPRTKYVATIDGLAHDARVYASGACLTTCGLPCGTAPMFQVSVTVPRAPEVDCMACIARGSDAG